MLGRLEAPRTLKRIETRPSALPKRYTDYGLEAPRTLKRIETFLALSAWVELARLEAPRTLKRIETAIAIPDNLTKTSGSTANLKTD